LPGVLLNEPISANGIEMLQQAGFDVFLRPAGADLAQMVHKSLPARQIQAIIVRAGVLTATDLKLFPNLKIIARHGVGMDNLPLAYLKSQQICLTYTPGINARSVAELTLALMLAGLHRLPENIRLQTRQTGILLTGKTVGLVGYGRIAQQVEKLLQPFDVNLLVWNHRPKKLAAGQQVELNELLTKSQIISLHIPATSETKKMFDQKQLAKMRSDAFLVNTARGSLIDSDALYQALVNKRLAGAVVDVFTAGQKYQLADFKKLPNFIVTPHIGAETQEILSASSKQCATEIIRFFNGQALLQSYWS
jgi:D-3-phosphoglycerate dehydrogenase